jgi:hypothetical protein
MMLEIHRKGVKAIFHENDKGVKIPGRWIRGKDCLPFYARGNGALFRRFVIFSVMVFVLLLLLGPAGIIENIVSGGPGQTLHAETPKLSCMTVLYSGDERGTIQPCG